MSKFLSPSSIKRLPAAIRKLPKMEQSVFVLLRMRRDEVRIARELDITVAKAREMIRSVQEALVKEGALDLVQDPVFFPIAHSESGDGGGGGAFYEPAEKGLGAEERLALDRFYKTLAESVEKMPKEGRRLLSLWFNDEMRAKDILNFYRNLGLPVSSGKSIHETTEQDVFYAIEKNVRNLLEIVRSNMSEEDIKLTPAGLRAILEETGV
ncbi:MAG: hypothetical protein ACNS63_12280 [Candidatus Nitrospinota bacterium M3_3B_026]